MIKYAAFLRGINVGGRNIIKMEALKEVFVRVGLSNVSTYIQSGNVLFESHIEEDELKQELEKAIEHRFGFPVPVILRTIAELNSIINQCPFQQTNIIKSDSTSDGESVYVFFCSENLQGDLYEKFSSIAGGDCFHIAGKNIFVHFSNSIRNSKLASYIQKLETPCTSRNRNTVKKILLLAQEKSLQR